MLSAQRSGDAVGVGGAERVCYSGETRCGGGRCGVLALSPRQRLDRQFWQEEISIVPLSKLTSKRGS